MVQTPGAVALPSALPDASPALRACLFALSGARFAVDVRSAREVAVFDDLTAVPRAPRLLLGVANLRGTVVPIVDVGPLLDLPELRPARTVRTLVLRDGPTAPRGHASPLLVSGWITWAGETLALLDVPRILAVLRATLGTDEPAGRSEA